MNTTEQFDNVNRPKHYQSPHPFYGEIIVKGGEYAGKQKFPFYIQALDVIKCWGLQNDFYLGNVIKYILRSGKKDETKYLEDLKKARFYLDARISEMEDQQKDN